ncbi:bifunctional diguanylate cyclase/phosphodiesterase [Eubacterium sp. MSJ-21]|nr:bifunctional diguanylate cyclase/phosphodiesterase [Eubacterium sp. MSJ-21]
MLNWDLAYDYAAIYLLLIIIMWYFHEKRIPLASHRTFLIALSAVFVSTGLEIVSTKLAQTTGTAGSTVFWVTSTLQHLALNAIPLLFAYYVLQIVHINAKQMLQAKWMLSVCGVIDVAVLVTNPYTNWVYEVDEGRYIYDYGVIVLITVAILAIVASSVVAICRVNHTLFAKTMVVMFHMLLVVIAVIMQLKTHVLFLNFVTATVCLTLYYYLQNPNGVIDTVTKQFNRRFLGEYLHTFFVNEKPFGIVVVAMDDFKFINKTYGVENGDNLLRQIGAFMDKLPFAKTVFRLGADQFCIVLYKELDQIDNVAQTVHERFRHPWYSENQIGIMMSASICCVNCPADASAYGQLIEVMDYSMSMAKRLKKGMITYAKDYDLGKIKQDKAFEKAVKQALDRDELMVYYQPIFSVQKGVYNSAEALVRLHDAQLGWISPEDFIPIAERNGMIIEMGEVILDKVCRFIHDFKLAQTTVEYIEVNISPVQLMQQHFSARVKQIMEKYDVRPEQINIEITETATISMADTVNANIMDLVQYGIKFSLDDYGSGYANIDYINHMPFSIIKLDKYIIWDAFKSTKAGITLKHTIGMLNELELHIVAEGVETAEMRDHLADIGCHYMQGWYYSKAVSDTEFIHLIEMQ